MSEQDSDQLLDLRILMVEDNEDDAVLLLRQLHRGQFRVRHARVQTGPDMEAALEAGPWDIVLSDHHMPAFDSMSALELLKSKGLDVPFIVVSGAIGEEAAVELLRSGAADFIKKGNWARLVPAVKRELREARHRRERARAREAEMAAEARYTALFENAVEGIFQSTPEGRFIVANPAMARILGYQSPEELVNSMVNIQEQLYVKPHRRDEFLRQLKDKGEVISFEIETYCRDRSIIWVSLNARAVFNEDGSIAYVDGILEDITSRRRAEEMLYENAFHDQLTGQPNRALFMDRLHRTLERARRDPRKKYAVLFLDLDRFKTINDSLGHQAGDELLVSVGKTLEECVRSVDTVARFGGDEFVVLLEDLSNFKRALAVTRRIQQALQTPRYIQSREVYTTTSVGIVLSVRPFDTAETVLRCADIAMYQAKKAGRNRFKVFNRSMGRQAEWRLEMETSLRRAVKKNQFLVHYQPIVSMADGSIRGLEALVRWDRPGKGMVSPAEFIPLAEETGLIDTIGSHVLATACRQIRDWGEETGRSDLFVTVNISGRQFRKTGFVDEVRDVIQDSGADPGMIKLEITESMLMENPQRMVNTLERLKNLGLSLAMDDFGTGYSSLSYLNRFPIDVIKIDRSFIRRMFQGRRDTKLVRTIVSLGRGMDMDVVAEGVEEVGQVDTLQDMGCDLAQGYYYSKPLPAEEATRLLREGRALGPEGLSDDGRAETA